MMRRSRLFGVVGRMFAVMLRIGARPGAARAVAAAASHPLALGRLAWYGVLILIGLGAVWKIALFVLGEVTLAEIGRVLLFGLITLARVAVLIALAERRVGADRRVGRAAAAGRERGAADRAVPGRLPRQPALPDRRLRHRAVPADAGYLAEPADDPRHTVVHPLQRDRWAPRPSRPNCATRRQNLGVRGWLWWRRVALPAVFPFYVTGAITASGGSWNASINAEVAQWGTQTGARARPGRLHRAMRPPPGISPRNVLGIMVLSLLVVILNRVFWRPLYARAERKFRIS